MRPLHALIFDLDGTLLDSLPDIGHAVNATLAAFGRPRIAMDQVRGFVGDGMMVTLQRAFDAAGLPIKPEETDTIAQEFMRLYTAQVPDLSQIYPHVVETLDAFQAAGVKLAICTNKQEAATFKLLDALDLTRRFVFVAGYDTFPFHKPHPGHVEGVLERLGVVAENTVMIGDSGNDIFAASGAGVKAVLVTYGYGVDRSLPADAVIGDFSELADAMRRMGFVW